MLTMPACESFAPAAMKIVSAFALSPMQRGQLTDAAPGAEIADADRRSLEAIGAALDTSCEVLLTFRIPEDALIRAPGLRWVQLLSAGADHVLRAGLPDGITLTTASGIHAAPIAEYVIASMLAYAHRLHLTMRAQLRREWARQGPFMAQVEELRGKTIGIIGYGSIGRETARIAQALGMRVIALKRDPAARADPGWNPAGLGDTAGSIPEKIVGPGEREALLRESDYIVVTLPLTKDTHKFIGAREFAAVKPGAYLVNIGRGEVIDQQAMIAALRDKRLGGAGLDVFEREPLEPESELWQLENVILTPHISGSNRGYMDKACELFADNLRRFASGQPLLNVVDRAAGY